jgi:hypothetical protein
MEQYEDDWDDVDRLWATGAPWRLYDAEAEQRPAEWDEPWPDGVWTEPPVEPESDDEKIEEAQSLRFLDRMRGK